MDHTSTDDIIRGVRQRRKHCYPTCCPVCGITVRPNEIEQHYTIELEKLHKTSSNSVVQTMKRKLQYGQQHQKEQPSCSTTSSRHTIDSISPVPPGATATTTTPPITTTTLNDPSDCWITYQRIKNNRQARLKIKSKKRKTDDPLCPICNERIADDIIAHVDVCLQRSEGRSNGATSDNCDDDDDDDDASVDVEAESFDEYEWAGQTRIRASSMLQGGYSATGFGTQITYKGTNTSGGGGGFGVGGGDDGDAMDDEEEDLNVDGDDTQIFGNTQYSELDVILPLNNDSDDKKCNHLYLRQLVIGQSSSSPSSSSSLANTSSAMEKPLNDNWNQSENEHPDTNSAHLNDSATHETINRQIESKTNGLDHVENQQQQRLEEEKKLQQLPDNRNHLLKNTAGELVTNATTANGQKQIIASLKEKIREYEMQIRNKSKCLICIDEFRIPVVSICCWHVHCEECWLRTLGARKLCPQCNMITSPSDLRRIYM